MDTSESAEVLKYFKVDPVLCAKSDPFQATFISTITPHIYHLLLFLGGMVQVT